MKSFEDTAKFNCKIVNNKDEKPNKLPDEIVKSYKKKKKNIDKSYFQSFIS